MNIPILDCDNTLYKCDALLEAIGHRIVEFMKIAHSDQEDEELHSIRKRYLRDYGTTLSGLIRHADVDPSDYLKYIHDINVGDFIEPNPEVRKLLTAIDTKKIIMSNAPRKHVLEVLEILNISDIPEKVYTIEDFDYDGKPFASSYKKVLSESNIMAENAVMVDDSSKNLIGAKEVGLKTCIIGSPNRDGFDYHINDISEILKVFKNGGNHV